VTGSRPPVDIAATATCNDEVTIGGTRDTDADVIASGSEPRRPRWRPGHLIWLLVITETVVLAVSVVIALHYRSLVPGPMRRRSGSRSPR
jgi:hypothetical protein